MGVRLYEGDKTETGGAGIEITDNKVVNLILRELNNLTKINSNNEVYTDLQLDDNLLFSAVLPVGVTTGRVLQANGRPVTGTLISAKTTSGDNIKILYGDDGEIRVDNGTGVWKILQYKLTAGEGIEIGTRTFVDTQGPCPEGFHVPTAGQWSDIVNNLNGLVWNKSSCEELLKLPSAGSLSSSGTPGSISNLNYWSSSPNGEGKAGELVAIANGIYEPVNKAQYRACGLPIRPFKDTPVIPDDSWAQLSSGRIYRNESLGIISIRLNPLPSNRWITIADKNLGATSVYNVGDEKSESNCGKYYQWGNNYGFERNAAPAKTSAIAVDASSYGPRKYYYSDVFITASPDRSSVRNDNLWGGVSLESATIDNVITNTGVLSVNGQAGDVIVDTTPIVPVGDTLPANPIQGNIILNTTDNKLYIYDGTNRNSIQATVVS